MSRPALSFIFSTEEFRSSYFHFSPLLLLPRSSENITIIPTSVERKLKPVLSAHIDRTDWLDTPLFGYYEKTHRSKEKFSALSYKNPALAINFLDLAQRSVAKLVFLSLLLHRKEKKIQVILFVTLICIYSTTGNSDKIQKPFLGPQMYVAIILDLPDVC